MAVYCPTSAQTQRQFSLPPPGLHRLQCRPRSAGLPVANHAVIHSSFCEFTLCHVYAHVFATFRPRFCHVFGTFGPPALKRRAGQGTEVSQKSEPQTKGFRGKFSATTHDCAHCKVHSNRSLEAQFVPNHLCSLLCVIFQVINPDPFFF